MNAAAESVLARLLAAPKYRQVHPDTIADVVRQEAPRATDGADLERRARLKLHRVMAGYLLTGRPARLLRDMEQAVTGGDGATRAWCRSILARHFSTAERLPDLDAFYPTLFDLTGEARRIADLACALGPFTMPWLRDVTDAGYVGYDLNLGYVEIGNAFLARVDPESRVDHRDVLIEPASIVADVAFLFKTYHTMEDRLPGSGERLVADVSVPRVVVSFPNKAMNGRSPNFCQRHIDRLAALADRRGWRLRTSSLPSEDLVLVAKEPAGTARS